MPEFWYNISIMRYGFRLTGIGITGATEMTELERQRMQEMIRRQIADREGEA